MRNLWLVAKHEYRQVVGRRAFLLVTLALPLALLAIVAMAVFVATSGESDLPAGYVDQAGVLGAVSPAGAGVEELAILAYEDVEAGQAAVENGTIQALFVLPADYTQTLHSEVYYLEDPPSSDVREAFGDFVRANLVAAFPAGTAQRLVEGPTVTIYDIDSNRTFGRENAIDVILPFVATFFFVMATISASGYMLSVVAGEKENRTMEVMITSVTPGQLIGGKTAGLLAAALTQLAVFLVALLIGLFVAGRYVVELPDTTIPWGYLALMVFYFLPAYLLLSAIMVAIGAAVTEIQQGQQVAGLLNLLFLLPLFVLPFFFNDPGQPLIVFLTLFPPTTFMTVSLRWGLGTVPTWQLVVGWLLLVATGLFMIWVATRVFRVGMLRYGQALTFKGVVAAVRGGK